MRPAIKDRWYQRPPVEVVVVRSPACHLCEDAIEALEKLGREFPLRVRIAEIESPEGRAIVAGASAGVKGSESTIRGSRSRR